MPAAGRRAARSLGSQARSLCVAAREPVRRQYRHGLVAALAWKLAPLLQRDRDHRQPCRYLAPPSVPRTGAHHPVLDRHPRVREVHRPDRVRGDIALMRAVAVIDGEHYASVVRDALVELPQEIVACVLVGGTEKLHGGEQYGVPLASSLDAAITEYAPDVVLDLSDEPVLGPPARFRLAARALALGV